MYELVVGREAPRRLIAEAMRPGFPATRPA
jgi:hypothetical protein